MARGKCIDRERKREYLDRGEEAENCPYGVAIFAPNVYCFTHIAIMMTMTRQSGTNLIAGKLKT